MGCVVSWPVGTIIVCIEARAIHPSIVEMCRPTALPVEGGYYSVRGWATSPFHPEPVLYLNEIHAARNPLSGLEFGWDSSCFRRAESDHSEAGSVRQAKPARA